MSVRTPRPIPVAPDLGPDLSAASSLPVPIALDDDSDALTAPRIATMLVLSLLPFWMIPVAHVAPSAQTATGFFQYELPYYVANGRAAFERGNGILYPNPYDPAGNSPAIYAHWLPWTLGLLTAGCGFQPGDVVLIFTFVVSLAFALTTRQLVRARLPPGAESNVAYLLAMWGGGLLSLAGTVFCLITGERWLDSVLHWDPGRGMWFLNWGRNALFFTEAVYHTLVAACWLAEVHRRRIAANACLILLATTHPWSGLELLLTINLWRCVDAFLHRTRTHMLQLAMSALLLIGFLGYYKLWLPRFPEHAKLQAVWELDWSVPFVSALFAYLPVSVPAVLLILERMKAPRWERTELILLCALLVAVGLAFHDRLVKPVQPLHFTRGYIWMPLFLLGLPVLMRWWTNVRITRGRLLLSGIAVLALGATDNMTFCAVHAIRQYRQHDGFHLNVHQRTLLADLHRSPFTVGQIVLSDCEPINYLLPTYADVRPWLGHQFNTPNFPQRRAVMQACFVDNRIDASRIPDEVDIIVVSADRDVSEFTNAG